MAALKWIHHSPFLSEEFAEKEALLQVVLFLELPLKAYYALLVDEYFRTYHDALTCCQPWPI